MRKFVNVILDIIIVMLIAGIAFVGADIWYMDNHQVHVYSGQTDQAYTEVYHIDGRVDYVYE